MRIVHRIATRHGSSCTISTLMMDVIAVTRALTAWELTCVHHDAILAV